MAGSSDPLLLSKAAQKLTKGTYGFDGTFLITQSNVKWIPDDNAAAKPVTLLIASITKQQQVSGKPLLRLLGGAEPLGLSFASEEDKNEVLEFLKQLKPYTAAPATATASSAHVPSQEQKRKLFANDKDLEILYGQLVAGNIISEEDFWRSRRSALEQSAPKKSQHVGLSSVMHQVEHLHDGQTERVSISLTPQDIERIFTERPEVHQAFLANVPHALSEKEFWEKYFKLEYKKAARRKKLASTGKFNISDEDFDEGDELFAPFKKQIHEQERKQAMSQLGRIDPTVNLAAEFADRFSIAAGFGSSQGAQADDSAVAGKQPGSKELARDVNRHAAHVLDGGIQLQEIADAMTGSSKSAKTSAEIAASVAAAVKKAQGTRDTVNKQQGEGRASEETLEEWRRRASAALDDLTGVTQSPVVPLDIQDPRVYFSQVSEWQTVEPSALEPDIEMISNNSIEIYNTVLQALESINPRQLSPTPCDPRIASQVLQDLARDDDESAVTKFGPIAATAIGSSPADVLNSVMLEYFRMQALKTNELLRHFWACFPMTSQIRKTKAAKLVEVLEQHRKELRATINAKPGTSEQVFAHYMMHPLMDSIDAALDKYDAESK